MSKRVQAWVGVLFLGGVLGGCAGCMGSDAMRPAMGALVASPPQLDFGPTTLGLPVQRTVVLSQRGLVAADVLGVTISPANSPFRLATPPPVQVALNRSISVELTYEPRRDRTHRGTLTLELANGDPVVIDLEGRGVDARIVTTDAVDFGRPALGATRVRTVTLRNPYETDVPFSLVFEGADASEFSPDTEWSLKRFQQRDITLHYAPTNVAGKRQVSLKLKACPLCAFETIDVTADAVKRPLEIVPDPVRLGAVTIDAQRVVEVRITNATDEPISVNDVAFGPDTAAGFTLEAPRAPAVLNGLESTTAQVRFSPTTLGRAQGVLTVRSNALPEGDVDVPMSAAGGGAMLVVVPSKLDFRPVPIRARRILEATISNGGGDAKADPLHITAVRVEGDAFVLEQTPPAGTTLRAGERHVVSIAFAPGEERTLTGTLIVESDDPQMPRFEVPLSGLGLPAAQCELTTHPDVLDFGLVRANKGAALGVHIENTGTETCSLWNQQMTGDDVFTLPRNRGTLLLAPGEAVHMPVAFEPRADGMYEATMRFDTNRPANAALAVPIRGGSHSTCLSPEPAYLDFGERRLDCGSTRHTGSWRNVCSTPITVSDLFVGEGADVASFSIVSSTATPTTLSPGDVVDATVQWTPSVPGYTSRPLFSKAEDDSLAVLIPLSVDAREEATHDELRVQPAPAKVDLLWVVDNTASMKDERAGLARSIDAFLADADARGVDYHIGVTTTGVGPAPSFNGETCNGGVHGGESGRLFPVDHSSARIVHPGLANRAAILSNNLDVGGCHSVEQGLRAAFLALSPPLIDNDDDARTPEPNDGNNGFLRPDAHLAVVVVSDEDDESPETVAHHVRALRSVKPTSPFTFAAIVAPEGGCESAVEPGTRYLDTARQLGGLSGNVCDPHWTATLDALAEALFKPVQRWTLAAPADVDSLEISIDGVATRAWRYDAASNSVAFDTLPAPGSRLRFQYSEPCP